MNDLDEMRRREQSMGVLQLPVVSPFFFSLPSLSVSQSTVPSLTLASERATVRARDDDVLSKV